MKNLRMQQEMTDRGRLEIRVNARIQARPVSGARVTVSYTGDPQNVIEELITDGDGRTETLDLATPPLEYSLEPNVNQPYSEYTVKVEAEGYEPVEVTGSELLSGEQSVQQVDLGPAEGAAFADVTIPDHTLFGEYPAKIPESEIKPTWESGEIVLSRVVIRSMSLSTTERRPTARRATIMCGTATTSKTWRARKSMQHGRMRRSGRISSQSCHLR